MATTTPSAVLVPSAPVFTIRAIGAWIATRSARSGRRQCAGGGLRCYYGISNPIPTAPRRCRPQRACHRPSAHRGWLPAGGLTTT